MPQKMGNGGHGPEDYNANNGQYVEDGIPNSSYDNPDEKILGSMGLTKDELDDFFNFNDDNQNKNNNSSTLTREELEEQEISETIVPRTDKRKQLPRIWGFLAPKIRQRQIQEDIGCSIEEAEQIEKTIWDYTGGWSREIGTGEMFDEWLLLEKYIQKAPKYDGTIYRGLSFFDNDGFDFIQQLKVGGTIKMQGISSWTSNEEYTNRFSNNWDERQNSVILICENKNGVGIQQNSQYGEKEAEVIHSTYARWKIKKIEETPKKGTYNTKTIKVYLEEL